MRLHPQWSSEKVKIYPVEGYPEPLRPPERGLGRSDGGKDKWKVFQGAETTQGIFKHYKEFGVERTVKFAKCKRPASGQ